MSWLGGIGAGLSSLSQSMQKREEEKRSREERLNAIRDKLSLVNAQAPEKRRVIPGQELPADVAGPPAPEMVETFKTSLEYDPEKGYVAKDEVLGSQRNQWSTTDKTAKEAGGKVYKKTTETDLAGNQRTSFDEEEAAKKLQMKRVLDGDRLVDRVFDEQMNPVRDEGSGPRHKPVGAGRTPEEIQAAIDYRDKLARGRIDLAEQARQDRYVGNFAAAEIADWREKSPEKQAIYNQGLGLPPNATEQQVRTAIYQRAAADRAAPTSESVPDPTPKPTPVSDEDAPFKRKPGTPPPEPNPMAVNDPKPKGAEKPAEKPKDEPKKEDKRGVKFDDPVMQKNFEEDEAEFRRILSLTQGKEARDKLIADYQRQMMELYDVRFK